MSSRTDNEAATPPAELSAEELSEERADNMMLAIFETMATLGSPRPIPSREWFIGQFEAHAAAAVEAYIERSGRNDEAAESCRLARADERERVAKMLDQRAARSRRLQLRAGTDNALRRGHAENAAAYEAGAAAIRAMGDSDE